MLATARRSPTAPRHDPDSRRSPATQTGPLHDPSTPFLLCQLDALRTAGLSDARLFVLTYHRQTVARQTSTMEWNSSSPFPEGVISFLDTDLYKLTMQCAVFKFFKEVPVSYAFTNRTPDKRLSRAAFKWLDEQIRSELSMSFLGSSMGCNGNLTLRD